MPLLLLRTLIRYYSSLRFRLVRRILSPRSCVPLQSRQTHGMYRKSGRKNNLFSRQPSHTYTHACAASAIQMNVPAVRGHRPMYGNRTHLYAVQFIKGNQLSRRKMIFCSLGDGPDSILCSLTSSGTFPARNRHRRVYDSFSNFSLPRRLHTVTRNEISSKTVSRSI